MGEIVNVKELMPTEYWTVFGAYPVLFAKDAAGDINVGLLPQSNQSVELAPEPGMAAPATETLVTTGGAI